MHRKPVLIAALLFVAISVTMYFTFKEYVFSSPDNCMACHFVKPYYDRWKTSSHNTVKCTKCHDYTPMKALSGQLKMLVGTYNPRPLTRVPDASCLQNGCHDKRLVASSVKYTKRGIDFDHRPHFEHSVRGIKLHCRSCHSDIVQGEHLKVQQNVCFLCHFKNSDSARDLSDCTLCHSAPKDDIPYKGQSFSHTKALAGGLLCADCHKSVLEGTGKVDQSKCYICHVDRTERYSDFEFMHNQHVGTMQLDCQYCHETIVHGRISMVPDGPVEMGMQNQ